jgi:hypothetical protein
MCELFGQIALWLFRSVSLSNWIEILKVVGAAMAFAIGVRQYNRAQIWKRLEFLSVEMRIFFDDVAVQAAMKMLDWRRRKIALFKSRGEDNDDLRTVDYDLVSESLGISPDARYGKEQSAIRDIFERFLEYLARFEGFIASGAIKPADLNPYLDYWIKLIAGQDVHSPEVTKQVLPSLWKFIDHYGYQDVRKFISRYKTVAFSELKR